MKNAVKNFGKKAMKGVRKFWKDESGMGTVEVILIIVVLIGLVIIFKEQIEGIVRSLFTAIRRDTHVITG
jgi:Flp pilus assembly pilin Flp